MKWFKSVVDYAWSKKRNYVFEVLEKIAPKNKDNSIKLLDVGCGSGYYTKIYQR